MRSQRCIAVSFFFSVILVVLPRSPTLAGEDEFYRRFVSLGDTNDFQQQRVRTLALIDTNNGLAKITGTLNLETLKEEDGLAAIRFGMTMEQIVTLWGKPKWLWAHCMGGLPTMFYADVGLGFDGDSLKEIRFNTYAGNVQFTNGLSPSSSMDECVKKVGEPAGRTGSGESGLLIYMSAKAKMTLQFYDGQITTIQLSRPDVPIVAITNLLAHVKDYYGKRVEVWGYFTSAPERLSLYRNKEDADALRKAKALYIMPFVKRGYEERVKFIKEGKVRVIGVFDYNIQQPELGVGHFNEWQAQLVALELVQEINWK